MAELMETLVARVWIPARGAGAFRLRPPGVIGAPRRVRKARRLLVTASTGKVWASR